MRILVIDDSATMRRIIKSHLTAMGFHAIVEAHDGEQALAKLAGEAIDLVITDWAMPTMSGPDLVRAVQAIEAGVNGYIVKPFTPQTLREKIQELAGDVATKP